MLTQEKPPIKIKPFSKNELHKKPFNFSKKAFLIIFSVVLGIVFGIYAIFPEPKSQENQLTDLINRIEGDEKLPSGEMRDYCHLMAVLRDSISPACVCALDGINWDNPPRSPEKLPEVWELIPEDEYQSNRFRFQHKTYTKIRIGFDAKDKNGNDKPHWHRENPNKKDKKRQYLDKNCNPIKRSLPDSHIYIRTRK